MALLENRNLHVLIDLLFTCQRALGYFQPMEILYFKPIKNFHRMKRKGKKYFNELCQIQVSSQSISFPVVYAYIHLRT